MATNDFKPFAIAPSANVTDQADYAALPAVLSGFSAGVASSAQINKALRQSTVLASVLAQFISNQLSADVLDNGDTTTLLNNLIAALNSNGAASFLQKANNLGEIKAAGAVAQAAALTNLGLGATALSGRLLNVRTLTSSGVYTPTTGTNWIRVRAIGGGGAGGGGGQNSSTTISAGSGGGAGSYAEAIYTSGFNGITVTIGAGGVGNSGNSGSSGGLTIFGALLTCPGGGGGPVGQISTGTIAQYVGQGIGGGIVSGTGIIFSGHGQSGMNGLLFGTAGVVVPGIGAGNPFGGGGGQAILVTNGPAISPGAGGGGTGSTISNGPYAGGAGASGIVIIEEYA